MKTEQRETLSRLDGAVDTSVPVVLPDRDVRRKRPPALSFLLRLETLDPDQSRIVELRFFAGLTVEETAAVLDISPATVKREWAIAKGWLYRALTEGAQS